MKVGSVEKREWGPSSDILFKEPKQTFDRLSTVLDILLFFSQKYKLFELQKGNIRRLVLEITSAVKYVFVFIVL